MHAALSWARSRAPSAALALAGAALVVASIWPLRQWVDRPALDLFYAYDGSPWTAPAELVTELGRWSLWFSCATAVAVAAMVAGGQRLARGASQLALALLLAGLSGTALKVAFGEPVTDLSLALGNHDFTWFRLSAEWHAFPSGHAMTVGAVVATAWSLRLRWRTAIAAAGLFVAASRFIIAVHFVSDVVAGLALGALCAFAAEAATARFARS
jgi:membrane-associated phospholipid phosphatase